MSDMPDWTTPEYLANVAADELKQAMAELGIGFIDVHSGEDGAVSIAFQGLRDAEALMTLAVEADSVPGSLYDRATTSCVSLTAYAEGGAEPSPQEFQDLIGAGWTWIIHPAMRGRRMDWHVTLDVPLEDAYQLVGNLRTLRHGGAL